MRSRNEFWEIVSGVLFLLGLHIAAIAILAVLAYIFLGLNAMLAQIFFFAIFGIGLFQLLYAIPLAIWLNRKRQSGRMKGVIICAVVTALLNGGCYLWLFSLNR